MSNVGRDIRSLRVKPYFGRSNIWPSMEGFGFLRTSTVLVAARGSEMWLVRLLKKALVVVIAVTRCEAESFAALRHNAIAGH